MPPQAAPKAHRKRRPAPRPCGGSSRLACCTSPRACQSGPYRSLLARSQKREGPRRPSGGGRTAGASGGLLNQPSSDGENGNAAARNSFQRQFEVDHRRPAALPCPQPRSSRMLAACTRAATVCVLLLLCVPMLYRVGPSCWRLSVSSAIDLDEPVAPCHCRRAAAFVSVHCSILS